MTAWKILLTDGLEESGQAILRASAETTDHNGITADELLNPETISLYIRRNPVLKEALEFFK